MVLSETWFLPYKRKAATFFSWGKVAGFFLGEQSGGKALSVTSDRDRSQDKGKPVKVSAELEKGILPG